MEEPTFFETPLQFDKWLNNNHQIEEVLWVGYYKKHTGIPSITWEESVIEALRYGWIDGLRKSIDGECYKIRFTPRKKNSIWSNKNINTVEQLIKGGLMQKHGLDAYQYRTVDKSRIYGYELGETDLPKKYKKQLMANKEGWLFFSELPPSTKRISVRWVISAKKEETRDRRFKILLDCSVTNTLIPALVWSKKR